MSLHAQAGVGINEQDMQRIDSELQEYLNDPVTLDTYTDPMILNSGHSLNNAHYPRIRQCTQTRENISDRTANTLLTALTKCVTDPLIDPISKRPMEFPVCLLDRNNKFIPGAFCDKKTAESPEYASIIRAKWSMVGSAGPIRYIKDFTTSIFLEKRRSLLDDAQPEEAKIEGATFEEVTKQLYHFLNLNKSKSAENVLLGVMQLDGSDARYRIRLTVEQKFELHWQLANIYYRKGNIAEANKWLSPLAQQASFNVEIDMVWRIQTLVKLGDIGRFGKNFDEARGYYQKAQEIAEQFFAKKPPLNLASAKVKYFYLMAIENEAYIEKELMKQAKAKKNAALEASQKAKVLNTATKALRIAENFLWEARSAQGTEQEVAIIRSHAHLALSKIYLILKDFGMAYVAIEEAFKQFQIGQFCLDQQTPFDFQRKLLAQYTINTAEYFNAASQGDKQHEIKDDETLEEYLTRRADYVVQNSELARAEQQISELNSELETISFVLGSHETPAEDKPQWQQRSNELQTELAQLYQRLPQLQHASRGSNLGYTSIREATGYFASVARATIDCLATVLIQYRTERSALLETGVLYFRLGEFDKAEFYINKTLKVSPNDKKAKQCLAAIYKRTGREVGEEKAAPPQQQSLSSSSSSYSHSSNAAGHFASQQRQQQQQQQQQQQRQRQPCPYDDDTHLVFEIQGKYCPNCG